MTTFNALVELDIDVTIDEAAFTEEFLAEFQRYYYPSVKSVEDHARYLAQLAAIGSIPEIGPYNADHIIEGYGEACGFGIQIRVKSVEADILE